MVTTVDLEAGIPGIESHPINLPTTLRKETKKSKKRVKEPKKRRTETEEKKRKKKKKKSKPADDANEGCPSDLQNTPETIVSTPVDLEANSRSSDIVDAEADAMDRFTLMEQEMKRLEEELNKLKKTEPKSADEQVHEDCRTNSQKRLEPAGEIIANEYCKPNSQETLETEDADSEDGQSDSQESFEPADATNGDIPSNSQEMYPRDTYSFIAAKPTLLSFCFGLFVIFFQDSFLSLLIIGVRNTKDRICFPIDVTMDIWLAKALSLFYFLAVPLSSLQDMISGCENFPSYRSAGQTSDGSKIWYMRLASLLKILQGLTAALAVFFLVMTSMSVLDVVLNFTAINFISEMDDALFQLAESGMLGTSLNDAVGKLKEMHIPNYRSFRTSSLPRALVCWFVQWFLFFTFVCISTFFFASELTCSEKKNVNSEE